MSRRRQIFDLPTEAPNDFEDHGTDDEHYEDHRVGRGACRADPNCELLDGHYGDHYVPDPPVEEGYEHQCEYLLVAKLESRTSTSTMDTQFIYKCPHCGKVLD